MNEVTDVANFLKASKFEYNSVTVTGDAVTFARLPEQPSMVLVPNNGKKSKTLFEEFYDLSACD